MIKSEISPGVPDECFDMPGVPDGHGSIQTVDVTTEDGITLQLWHVSGDASKPVLIMHGLECSSRDWFTGLDTECLPWKLHREGFDVWVGNNRGNFLTTTTRWDWTYEEM